MKLLAILPVLAIVLVAGCVGQAPGEQVPIVEQLPAETPEGPGTTEPAKEPLPPPSSEGVGFVLVSPQPGQQIFSDQISIVIAPINLTIVPPGTEPQDSEGYFVLFMDSMPRVELYEGGPAYSYTFSGLEAANHTLRVEVRSGDGKHLSPPLVRNIFFTTGGPGPQAPAGCKFMNPSCGPDYFCNEDENICVPRGETVGA